MRGGRLPQQHLGIALVDGVEWDGASAEAVTRRPTVAAVAEFEAMRLIPGAHLFDRVTRKEERIAFISCGLICDRARIYRRQQDLGSLRGGREQQCKNDEKRLD